MPEKRLLHPDAHDNVPQMEKKQRMSSGLPEVLQPEIFTREAASDTALEIDIMILDYQAWLATECLVETFYDSPRDAVARLQRHLQLFNTWLMYFKERHPTYHADDQLHLRIALLRFSALYFRRLEHGVHVPDVHELVEIRSANLELAGQWIVAKDRVPSAKYDEDRAALFDDQLPVPQSALQDRRQQNLAGMRISSQPSSTSDDHFYGSISSVSLLDILPSFMQICAAVLVEHDCVPHASVIRLLCDFMRQASLEQYLVYGAKGCDAIDQAFAWGCFREQPIAQTEHWAIDNMFRDTSTGKERVMWTQSRESVLEELMGDALKHESVQHNLENLAIQYPLAEFDARIRECVNDLYKVIEAPILVQLEQGRLKHLSPEATAAFLKDCGLEDAMLSISIS